MALVCFWYTWLFNAELNPYRPCHLATSHGCPSSSTAGHRNLWHCLLANPLSSPYKCWATAGLHSSPLPPISPGPEGKAASILRRRKRGNTVCGSESGTGACQQRFHGWTDRRPWRRGASMMLWAPHPQGSTETKHCQVQTNTTARKKKNLLLLKRPPNLMTLGDQISVSHGCPHDLSWSLFSG